MALSQTLYATADAQGRTYKVVAAYGEDANVAVGQPAVGITAEAQAELMTWSRITAVITAMTCLTAAATVGLMARCCLSGHFTAID